MTHPYTPIVQLQIIGALNVMGQTLVGDAWETILKSPVPDEEIDAMLSQHAPIPAPVSPRELQSCQHHRIDNNTARCKVCDEPMVSRTVEAVTVLSAPNINPCTNPEHLRAIAAGEEVNCVTPYVAGPTRQVVVGYESTYQCERCTSSIDLVEGEVFVPDCGRSHRGDLIRQQFSNVLPAGEGQ